MKEGFSHITREGDITMVNVIDKSPSQRVAIAQSTVYFNEATFALLEKNALPKGDVLITAKIAGIMAAKRSAELIPMCHPLSLTYVDVRFTKIASSFALIIEAEVHTHGVTGVEIEALVAVQIASITVYDMCKAVQKDICIGDCRLIYKSGGKNGEYKFQV